MVKRLPDFLQLRQDTILIKSGYSVLMRLASIAHFQFLMTAMSLAARVGAAGDIPWFRDIKPDDSTANQQEGDGNDKY